MKTTALIAALIIVSLQLTCFSQDSKTNQAQTSSVTNSSSATQEKPRALTKEDGIQFEIHAAMYYTSSSHLPHGMLGQFGLADSSGKFIELELVGQQPGMAFRFFDGVITTKMFGDIILTSTDPMSFSATETQIKKIHEFLSRAKK